MFSSRGCICAGAYYSVYWVSAASRTIAHSIRYHWFDQSPFGQTRVQSHVRRQWLVNPADPSTRNYGLTRVDLRNGSFAFTRHELPNSYYSVFCEQDDDALLLVMSPRPNDDPERVNHFWVQKLSLPLRGQNATTLAGPVVAPAKEYYPISDGVFSYDSARQALWASFGDSTLLRPDSGVTHTLDLASGVQQSFSGSAYQGYLVNANAASGWGTLKSLKRKHTKLTLELVHVTLADSRVHTSSVADITQLGNSMDLPAEACNGTLYTFNTDNYHWFNITAISLASGKPEWNLDTLTLLPSSQFAFVTALACTDAA